MADPLIRVWPAGQAWYRCHDKRYTETAFNGSGKGDARFSPISTPSGKVIPTIYAGARIECALMETIFHTLPTDLSGYILDMDDLIDTVVSHIAPTRDINLIDLTTVGLRRLKLRKTDIIETSPLAYPKIRQVAENWHRDYPDVDGLVWMSRQYDESNACVLFGDRLANADLSIVSRMTSVFAEDNLSSILALGMKLGIKKIYAAGTGETTFAALMDHAK
jgi:RES domain